MFKIYHNNYVLQKINIYFTTIYCSEIIWVQKRVVFAEALTTLYPAAAGALRHLRKRRNEDETERSIRGRDETRVPKQKWTVEARKRGTKWRTTPPQLNTSLHLLMFKSNIFITKNPYPGNFCIEFINNYSVSTLSNSTSNIRVEPPGIGP